MKVEDAIAQLKLYIENNPKRIEEEKEVIERFGNLFNPNRLNDLRKEEFRSFLSAKNNKHWTGIHRSGNLITQNMAKLREALGILLNEDEEIEKRLSKLFPKNKPSYIKGLGRAIITPILMVVYPEKYGVYNQRSEAGLELLGLHPTFKGENFAERYMKINSILNKLAKSHDVRLFQLDDMFWLITKESEKPPDEDEDKSDIENSIAFVLEKHLEDFLIGNWEKISLIKELEIYEEDGDIAQQYSTGVGPIDILAREKSSDNWVVIELKKGRDSARVVGQILSYMQWIKENKAKNTEKVKGIIIAGEADERIKYALRATQADIEFLVYDIKFSLKKP